MPVITAIEPQQKNPHRVNIHLDGEFAFGLARILTAWLNVGQTLDTEKVAALKAEDEREVVYLKALHFLSYRPRSSAEVRKNLEKHTVSDALITATLERLQQKKLIDDDTFARMWIENRSEFRPRSRSALAFELRRKGIDREIIDAALEENVDEEALALAAARKYSRRLAGLEWSEFRKKISGFLARRGFSYSTIAPLVPQVWEECQTSDNTNKS